MTLSTFAKKAFNFLGNKDGGCVEFGGIRGLNDAASNQVIKEFSQFLAKFQGGTVIGGVGHSIFVLETDLDWSGANFANI